MSGGIHDLDAPAPDVWMGEWVVIPASRLNRE